MLAVATISDVKLPSVNAAPSRDVPIAQMASSVRSGHGTITVERIASRSSVTRLSATSPLKLLVPRHHAQAAWIFGSTYGGGLVEGDRIDMEVDIKRGSTALLGTQASTKVYSCAGGRSCSQSLRATIDDDALLVLCPDAITCFADAIYQQTQRIEMTAGASLVSIDWFTAGRIARGERWAFRSYRSKLELIVDGKLLVHDALLLDPDDGPIGAAHRMGRYNCMATVALLGPRVAQLAAQVLERVSEQAIGKRLPLIQSASALPGGGVLMRAAGETTQAVTQWIRDMLSPIVAELGDDPWGRKM